MPETPDGLLEAMHQVTATDREFINTGRSTDGDLIMTVLKNPGQRIELTDLEPFSLNPFRARGVHTAYDAPSFAALVNRYKDPASTTVWADKPANTFHAVLDDHVGIDETTGPSPEWGQHRVTLQLHHTDDWKLWTNPNVDGKLQTQVSFAEFLERAAINITQPDPATFLEIAMSLRATKGVDFQSSFVQQSGELGFRYEETVTAKAGQKGQLDIPRSFTIEVQPYEGSGVYPLQALLLYRITNDGLGIGYRLIRPNEVLRQVFDDTSTAVAAATSLPVYAGKPRP